MNEFVKAFRDIDKAVRQGQTRALNRALSNTKTQLVKTLADETGMKSSIIKDRVLDIKATQTKQSVQLAIATKVGINLGDMQPREQTVNTRRGKRTGVSVSIQGNRELVPGGWLWTAPNGKTLVLGRKGSARYPTVALRWAGWIDVVAKYADQFTQYMNDRFMDMVADQVSYAVQSKFDSD